MKNLILLPLVASLVFASLITASAQETAEISREGADGRLVTIAYTIKEIKSGTVQDPKLQAGDRIEVSK